MINVLVSGASGKMGRVIADCISARDDMRIVAGVDKITEKYADFEIKNSFNEITEKVDVIIDFSHPMVLDDMLLYAKSCKIPVVIATTGYTEEQKEKINKAAEVIPVFFTFNLSIGINLLTELAKRAAAVLGGDFDIEIVEKHHNQKIDAPSGTALMIADSLNESAGDKYCYEYDRHSKRKKRSGSEIGIHSVRGGTIVGEHEVIFAGRDEVITLSHQATSKEVFAVGAVNAAAFLFDKKAGIYTMNEMLKEND